MKIIDIQKSFELCAEAGWYGYDIILDQEITLELIQSLGSLGRLTYLSSLRTPFFKVDHNDFIIKGMLGKKIFRIGIEGNNQQTLDFIISNLN